MRKLITGVLTAGALFSAGGFFFAAPASLFGLAGILLVAGLVGLLVLAYD